MVASRESSKSSDMLQVIIIIMSKFYDNVPQREERRPEQPNKLTLDDNIQVEQPMFPMISASSHPMWALIHILLKAAVVAVYLLAPLVTQSFLAK